MDRLGFTVLILALPMVAGAQLSNQRCAYIPTSGESVLLDSLSVLQESIEFNKGELQQFSYDLTTGRIRIENYQGNKDSLRVCFDVLPFAFHQTYGNRTLAEYDSNVIPREVYVPEFISERNELFRSDSLSKSGSITRGVSFGNTQNVFVNSSLNLQLDGKLSDDLNIRAVINDQNIPFQPEGNTQQLQEFDKVFIQLYNDNLSLTAGDIVMQNRDNHFMRYYKNVQGGLFNINYKTSDKSATETTIGVAVGKGKFASTLVTALEGVQGPYRLRGPNNERFIIVLANSEKVYLDGKLLKRGFDYDYVIDYNLAEVTFTTNVLITQFSRIRIDFEYSEQNYNRTVFNASHRQNFGKTDFFFDLYSEKDNEKNPILFDLSNDERQRLNDIGDTVNLAALSGVDSLAFSEERILYKKIDTLDLNSNPVNGIFKFSTDSDSAFFNVSFSEVGFGNGDYVLFSSSSNGRIYQWVSPIAGLPQGTHSPIIVVPLPIKKQLISTGLAYNISEQDKLFVEGAFSSQDVNLFSELDANDNNGHAFKVGYEMENKTVKVLKGYSLSGGLDYEFNDRFFNPIDRFRYIEFDRDWSVDEKERNKRDDEKIAALKVSLDKDTDNHFSYKLVRRERGEAVNGYQHYSSMAKSFGRLKNTISFFKLNNEVNALSAKWSRLRFDTRFVGGAIVPGYTFDSDKNEVFFKESDSLSTAMNFTQHQFYIQSGDSIESKLRIDYSYREDFLPNSDRFILNNTANTANLQFSTKLDNRQRLDLRFTYRELSQSRVPGAMKEQTTMGRVDWFGTLFERGMQNEVTYAIANGRELKREFIYLEVPTGDGTHAWRDLNEDGIQDLNEFFEAINYDERNYAKIFVPTDEYITAFNLIFNYRLRLAAPKSWRLAEGFKKLISRFSNNSSWSINKKITDDRLSIRLNPFNSNLSNENLISTREVVRSAFFYDRANPRFGLNANITRNESKQLLTNGFETRILERSQYGGRWSPQKTITFRLNVNTTGEVVSSDFLTERNYQIRGNGFSPEIVWQPGNKLRLTGSYSYKDKRNSGSDSQGEGSIINELNFELRSSRVSNRTMTFNFSYFNIAFEGKENSVLGYALLEALRPGQNIRWSLNWQQKLLQGLQLNLNYDGRKSEGNRLVNIGRVQVSALF